MKTTTFFSSRNLIVILLLVLFIFCLGVLLIPTHFFMLHFELWLVAAVGMPSSFFALMKVLGIKS